MANPADKPFLVVTEKDSRLHSGYDTDTEAKSAAETANASAKELGIQTRYVVKAAT